jgi:hypothetical protein
VYYNEKDMQKLSQLDWDTLNRECIGCVEIRPVRELMGQDNSR